MSEYKRGDRVVSLVSFINRQRGNVEIGDRGVVVSQQGQMVEVSIDSNHWLFYTSEIRKDEEGAKDDTGSIK